MRPVYKKITVIHFMKHSFLTVIPLFIFLFGHSQKSLDYYIQKTKAVSYQSGIASIKLSTAQSNYNAFRRNYKPTLSLSGSVPVYNKDNFAVTQPDGSVKFISRSQNNSNLSIGLSQPVFFTGGTISLNTDLTRLDDFVRKTTRYNGTPVFIRLNQPLFAFNGLKWDKKIEPLKIKEATLTNKEAKEWLSYNICKLFFAIAEAQTSEQLEETNLQNNITNLAIEKRRMAVGTSTEDKVLQLEMRQIIYQQRLSAAKLAVNDAFLSMQALFPNKDTFIVKVDLPTNIPVLHLNKEEIIATAKRNLAMYIFFSRKQLEAQSNLAKAKTQGRQVNVTASYGLNNAEDNIPAIYRNPNNQQRYSVTFSIPIIDWGKRNGNIELAKLQEKESELSMIAEEAKLIAEAESLINQLPVFRDNITNAQSLDILSQKRYSIATRLYQLGKISLLELQAAELEKDNAAKFYVYSLRQFWEAYYLLKAKTMATF